MASMFCILFLLSIFKALDFAKYAKYSTYDKDLCDYECLSSLCRDCMILVFSSLLLEARRINSPFKPILSLQVRT